MIKLCFATVLFLAIFATNVFALDGEELKKAESILVKAEKVRAPDQGVSYVDLRSESSKTKVIYDLEVLMGTNKRAFIDFKDPPIERGRRMLVIGQQYFAKFRHSKSAIPISRREAVGNSTFALADIFQLNLDDYSIESMKSAKDGLLHLTLKARSTSVPYAQVEYYVDQKEHFPIRAEFYGISGKHLKSLFVEEKKKFNGTLRASKVRMDDVVQVDKKSWWITKKIIEKTVPQKVFTKDYLVRD
jgi:hypothetical protein